MRKLLTVLIMIHAVMFSFLFLRVSVIDVHNQTLYDNTTSLLFIPDYEKPYAKKRLPYIFALAQKHDVSFSKYVYKNDKQLIIYTTDPSFHQSLHLLSGHYPKPFTKQYIVNANRPMQSNEQCVGTFLWNDPHRTVMIKSLSNVQEVSLEGIMYVNCTDRSTIRTIVHKLNQDVGDCKVDSFHNTRTVAVQYFLQKELVLALSLFICWLAMILVYTHVLIDRTKQHVIQRLYGFSLYRIAAHGSLPTAVTVALYGFASILFVAIWSQVTYGGFFYAKYVPFFLFFIGLAVVFLYVYTLCFVYIQVHFFHTNQAIKGFKPLLPTLVLNGTFKSLFMIVFLLSSLQWIETKATLQLEREGAQSWEKTHNVYQTVVKYISFDDEVYRPYQLKLKNFYCELEKKGAFLMDAGNYEKLSWGQYLYEANAPGEKRLYSPSGKCVKINANYLKRHPLYQNGIRIGEHHLVRADLTMNILVPQSLKRYENKIKHYYTDYFYFHKIKVPTFYGKPRAPIKRKEAGLRLHIVYVDDGQKYFSYNPDVYTEYGHEVFNPIAIVDTENMDPSYYSTKLTRSVFLEVPADQTDAYEFIYPTVKKTDTLPSIQSLKPLYAVKGETIAQLEQEKTYLSLILTIVFLAMFIISYSYIAKYMERQKLRLYVQKIFGYGLLERIPFFLIASIALDVLLVAIVVFVHREPVLAPIGMGLLGYELGIFFMIYMYFDRKTTVTFLKGART